MHPAHFAGTELLQSWEKMTRKVMANNKPAAPGVSAAFMKGEKQITKIPFRILIQDCLVIRLFISKFQPVAFIIVQ